MPRAWIHRGASRGGRLALLLLLLAGLSTAHAEGGAAAADPVNAAAPGSAATATSSTADAAATSAGGVAGPNAGASDALRGHLQKQPSIWDTLREQYATPAAVPALPAVPPQAMAPTRLTLREAIASALEHNPGLLGQSLTPLAQEQGILQAQAQFDSILGIDLNLSRLVAPAPSVLTGAVTSVSVNGNGNLSLQKGLLSGGTLRLDWTNNRLYTNSIFQGLVPQYQPQAVVSLNQPLLRDFGLYFTTLRIHIAETATDAAIEDYKAQVANFIEQVIRSYLDVILDTEQLRVRRDSYELALRTVHENRTRVDVGVLPPVAIKESEAEAARREEDVIVAQNALDNAERALRQIVYLPTDLEYLTRPVEPIDHPIVTKIEVSQDAALEKAIANRPELQSARLQLHSNDLNVALNKNQLLPRVDLFGSYGVNALSGHAVPVTATNPTTGQALSVVSPFGGTYGDALGRLVSNDFYSYEGGIRIQMPLANAQADAQYTQSKVQRAQAEAQLRQRISDVTLEVGRAVGDVESNSKRIEATRVARELSEENLRNQTKRYDVGMATTTDMLKFQNDVASAQLAEIQAVIDYNNSLAELQRSQGTLLARFNVVVEPRQPTNTPWWARF